MQRKQRLVFKDSVPVIKNFDFNKRTQEWNGLWASYGGQSSDFYINETLQSFCEYLKDLFCIDEQLIVVFRNYKDNQSGYTTSDRTPTEIVIGAKDGVRATTVVHEFIHAMGYEHEWEINGYSDFRSNCNLDNYSRLIVKDIFGRYEVLF